MAARWDLLTAGISRLSSARPGYVLVALGLYIVSVLITGARWRGFLRALGSNVSITQASLATFGGIAAGNLTPSRLGTDPCRVALIRLKANIAWTDIALAAGWDRLTIVPPIAVLTVMAGVGVGGLNQSWRTGVMAVGLVVVVVAGVVGIRRFRHSTLGLAGWWRHLRLDRVGRGTFAVGVGYSTLLWIQDVARLSCAALAVGVHLAPTQLATLSVLTIAGGLVPTVGGLVVVEGGLMAGLLAFGVEAPTAAAVVAIERAISFGFGTAAGGLIIALMGGRSLWGRVFHARDAGAKG